MGTETGSHRLPTLRGLALLVAASMLIATLGTTGATIIEGPVHDVIFGDDATFDRELFNYGNSELRECNTSGAPCWVIPKPYGEAISEAHVSDQTRVLDAESVVGVRYRLLSACDGQDTTFGLKATFLFNYTLSTSRSLGTGTSIAGIHLRARDTSETPYANFTAENGESRAGSENFALDLASEVDTVYTTTMGARSTATVLVDVPQSHDHADAEAYGSLESIALSFGDTTPPRSTFKLNGNTVSETLFLGWSKHAQNVTVTAYDPIVNVDSEAIPHSCVKHVEIKNQGVPIGSPLVLNRQQDPVSVVFADNKRYELSIVAVDYNDLTQTVPRTVKFGFDNEPPTIDVLPNPREPSGNNSWYKRAATGPQPAFEIICDDTNGRTLGNYAGCRQANHSLSTGGSGTAVLTTHTNISTPPETHAVAMTATGLDHAFNAGPADTSPTIKVDLNAPNIGRNNSVAPIFGGTSWWNQPVWVNLTCNDGAGSGCAHLRTRIPPNPIWGDDDDRYFDQEGTFSLLAEAEDVAGNVKPGSFVIGIDYTVPVAPVLSIISAFETHGGAKYTNVVPKWSWTSGSDVGSGVRHYNVYLDGNFVGTKPTWDRTYTYPSSMPDGEVCLEVRAVDNAGNVGESQEEPVCITLDRVKPVVTFNSPDAGKVYLWNGQTISLNNGAVPSVVLNGLWLNVSSTDAEPSSVIRYTQIYEVGDLSRTALSCQSSSTTHCNHEARATEGREFNVAPRVVQGEARDRSGNIGLANFTYIRVDLGVFRSIPGGAGTQSSPNGQVFWKGVDPAEFGAYEIHRDRSPYFLPCYTTTVICTQTHVDTVTNAGTTSWFEPSPLTGTWYYKIVYKDAVGVTSLSHESKINYDNAGMEISEAQECQQGKPVCV